MKTLIVVVYLLRNDLSLTSDQLTLILGQVRLLFHEAGIDLVFKPPKLMKDPCKEYSGAKSDKYKCLLKVLRNRKRLVVSRVNLVIGPPVVYGDQKQTVGYTITGSFGKRSLSYCGVTMESEGEDRREHAAYCIAHELGHNLGAHHDESSGVPVTIMRQDVLYYVGSEEVITWAKNSVEEMKQWIDL